MKYFFSFLFSFSILLAQENVVKTSELELFLFKVGFESLLKDVEITKDKSSLNENEIKAINEKIELIMSELYKNKRVLVKDSTENVVTNSIDKQEIESLKEEIQILKSEILSLKQNYKEKPEYSGVPTKQTLIKAIVRAKSIKVRAFPFVDAKVIKNLYKNSELILEQCDKYGWCKIKDKKEYVAKHMLWIEK